MDAFTSKPAGRSVLLVATVTTLAVLAARAFAPQGTRTVLEAAGPLLLVTWLTPIVLALLDASGMRMMLARIGRERPLSLLVGLRFGLEAVASTAPLGPVAADASMPIVFGKALELPVTEGMSIVGARKWALLAGHALSVTITLVVGARILAGITIPGVSLPASALLVVVVVSLSATALAILAIARRESYSDVRTSETGVKARVRRAIHEAAQGARAILAPRDGGATRLAILYTVLWLFEALDTYVLLRLLGAPVGFGDALVVETVAAIAKSLAFVSPGGLGAQDVAYAFAIGAVAHADVGAIAFSLIVLRRLRELCFVVVGFGLLSAIPILRRTCAAPADVRESLLTERGAS